MYVPSRAPGRTERHPVWSARHLQASGKNSQPPGASRGARHAEGPCGMGFRASPGARGPTVRKSTLGWGLTPASPVHPPRLLRASF